MLDGSTDTIASPIEGKTGSETRPTGKTAGETAGPEARLVGRKIKVTRGGATILHGIEFVARQGELVGVLGPSGCGKSTLLYALTGFRSPDSGSVLLNDVDVKASFQNIKDQIGFVPQDDVVHTALRVERALFFAAQLRLPHLTEEARKNRIDEVLRQLGLEERRKVRVRSLSGGQRKRVSIAMELLARPLILVADEPTSGLDPELEFSLTTQLRKMADAGHVVIVTTHVMASLSLLDYVCLLKEGRLVYCGPPSAMKVYFGVEDFADIYRLLSSKPASQWYSAYASSPDFRKYLAGRL